MENWLGGPARFLIFVTAGTAKYQFVRLLRMMDEIAGEIDEEVVFQVGSAGYYPRNGRCYDFMSRDQFRSMIMDARVIVSAGGAGTMLDALHLSKPVIAVPRSGRLGEHIGEQGVEFSNALAEEGWVHVAHDTEKLKRLLLDPMLKFNGEVDSERNSLVKYLRDYLSDLEKGKLRK